MIPKRAITNAVAGGWRNQSNAPISLVTGYTKDWERVALDPTFWQALGKALGWEEWEFVCPKYNCHKFYNLPEGHHGDIRCPKCDHWGARGDIGEWYGEWFCHLILTGNNTEAYWDELLAQPNEK